MYTGVLYNVFLCFFISFTSIVVFFNLRKIRKEKKVEYTEHLDYFSLFLGILWGIIGLRKTFTLFNLHYINIFLFRWISGPFNYIHLLPAFYYFGWSFFRNRKKIHLLFNVFFTFTIFLTVFAFLKYGIVEGELTYWGSHHNPNEKANKLFIFTVFLPAFICIIANFISTFKKWRKTDSPLDRQLFGFSVGFFIYAITGVIDSLGIFTGWLILLVRIGMMLAPIVFYLSATWDDLK